MKHPRKLLLAATVLSLAALGGAESPKYHTNAELDDALEAAVGASEGLVTVAELCRDASDRPVRLVRIGEDGPEHPTLLVVAGLDGRHLVGTEMALALVRSLAGDAAKTREWLGDRAIVVVPRLNLHGADAFFAAPREEVAGLAGTSDFDHDGETGEDLSEDLNGDRVISAIRVKDPEGTLVADGPDGAFLRPAKMAEGERGEWRVLTEGRDNDGDEGWNEEADGGTNAARNFPHRFEWFAKGSGRYQVCEKETRALADYLCAHANIAAVLTYNLDDNLLTSPPPDKTSPAPRDPSEPFEFGPRKTIELPNADDIAFIREEGKSYRKDFSIDKEIGVPTADDAWKGGFAAYAYYARGRFAVTTPAWTPGLQVALNEKSAKPKEEKPKDGAPPAKEKKKPEDKMDPSLKEQKDFLEWLQKTSPESWLGWNKIDHPDFPGKQAEVGSFAPFAQIDPPPALLDDLATTHTLLARRLVDHLPRVRIREASLTALGGGAAELQVVVENEGVLPDILAEGQVTSRARFTRVEVDAGEGSVIGDKPRKLLGRLKGRGAHEEVRWVLKLPEGRDSVAVKVESDMAGRDERTVRLEPAKESKP